MGRGVSSGGGQSSLGYLFGSGEAPKPAATNAPEPNEVQVVNNAPAPKPAAASPPVDAAKQVPACINSTSNNYMRADGQNTGNFITVWLYHGIFAVFPMQLAQGLFILNVVQNFV